MVLALFSEAASSETIITSPSIYVSFTIEPTRFLVDEISYASKSGLGLNLDKLRPLIFLKIKLLLELLSCLSLGPKFSPETAVIGSAA